MLFEADLVDKKVAVLDAVHRLAGCGGVGAVLPQPFHLLRHIDLESEDLARAAEDPTNAKTIAAIKEARAGKLSRAKSISNLKAALNAGN